MLRQILLRQRGLQYSLIHAQRAAAGRRTFLARRSQATNRPSERLNVQRLAQASYDYQRNRRMFLLSGAVAGVVSFLYTAWRIKQELNKPAAAGMQLDSPLLPGDPITSEGRKVVLHGDDGTEIVPTGNSTVPYFPRTIDVPPYQPPSSEPVGAALADVVTVTGDAAGIASEYTLVGLGLRSVSFLGIQVYVVGFYVATADVAALQAALVKKVNPIATALVPGERDELRASLLDYAQGESLWTELLDRGIPARSAFRVVPVRDTDFHHLRDGFVRAIQARSTVAAPAVGDNQEKDAFGEAMRDFRQLFNRGSVPKRKELLLLRDGQGRLSVVYDDGRQKKQEDNSAGRQLLGTVDDERVSRALWLNYLAGKKVASEPARKSIVGGIMEFVERPIGTVAGQVL